MTWYWAGDSDPVNNPGTQDTKVEYSKAISDAIEAAFLQTGGAGASAGGAGAGAGAGAQTFKLDSARFIRFSVMAQCRFDNPNKQRAVFREEA